MICEVCQESIKHDDGWTCEVCRLSCHDACDDPHRDDSGTYCESCWTKEQEIARLVATGAIGYPRPKASGSTPSPNDAAEGR